MDMKTSEIKILLQKYYEGSTTTSEETDLEKYFLNSPADPEFDADRLHFEAVASMRDEDIPVPEDLEFSVLETLGKVQRLQSRGNRRIIYVSLSIAAGLLLMVSTFLFISRSNDSLFVTDPKIAYAESREALEMVSKYFNQGTAKLSGLGKLNQAIEPLNKLNSLDKAAKSLSEFGKLNQGK
jgi:hypothetical protein